MERVPELPTLVPIEDLQSKFKSKLDLYTIMSVDRKYLSSIYKVNYFLPSIDKCPVAFLRAILSGGKKVRNNY